MTLKLNGSSSGYTAIDAPAAAGSNTLVLPTGNGSANQVLKTDGSGNLSWVAQAAAPKILQIQHANWTTEESLSNSFVSMASKSVTPIESNSDWLFIGQPARMLLKPGEIKADVYDSTNSNATGRREWRNYMSGVDSRPGCTSIWYHTAWNLSAGSAVTFQLRYYSDNSNNTVGDGSVSSDFIIIEVAT